MFYFNKKVRKDITTTLDRLAVVGGFAELGAAAAQAYLHANYAGFLVAVGFIFVIKIPVWLILAMEPENKEGGKK
jgi:hypothetical protein